MDIIMILIGFIGGGSLLASVIIGWIKQFIKEAEDKRLTDLTILSILFVVCLVISAGAFFTGMIPDQILGYATAIFGGAITMFEVFYKAIYKKAILGETDETTETAK
jgi:hypothetical protein